MKIYKTSYQSINEQLAKRLDLIKQLVAICESEEQKKELYDFLLKLRILMKKLCCQ